VKHAVLVSGGHGGRSLPFRGEAGKMTVTASPPLGRGGSEGEL